MQIQAYETLWVQLKYKTRKITQRTCISTRLQGQWHKNLIFFDFKMTLTLAAVALAPPKCNPLFFT